MTENTTLPSNVMEHAEPGQPAVGGGSQAYERKGSTNAQKKKKLSPYIQRAPHTSFIALASPVPRPELSGSNVHLAAKTGRMLAKALRER
jgi:hypothetical protein